MLKAEIASYENKIDEAENTTNRRNVSRSTFTLKKHIDHHIAVGEFYLTTKSTTTLSELRTATGNQ